MYKIGIIQHSSGAPAPAPAPLAVFDFEINWTGVYHYTQTNTFGYTTQRVKRTPITSIDVYYDPGVANTGFDVFQLYIRISPFSGGLPVIDPTKSPLNNSGFNLVQPPIDPMQGYSPIFLGLSDAYVTFGMEAGPDFFNYYDNSRPISIPVAVLVANTSQVIDTFSMTIDPRF